MLRRVLLDHHGVFRLQFLRLRCGQSGDALSDWVQNAVFSKIPQNDPVWEVGVVVPRPGRVQ